MGITVARATIQKILRDNGFRPFPGRPRPLLFERFRSGAKDALWALDFFAVKTAKGVWLQVLLVIDIHTRELLELRVHDGWDVDSRWTARIFNAILARTKRQPFALVRDHGTHFLRQFTRQLRVLGVDEELTPCGLPSLNCYAECAIATLRREAAPAHPCRRRSRAAVLPRRLPAVHERRPDAPGHRGSHTAGTVDGRAGGGGDRPRRDACATAGPPRVRARAAARLQPRRRRCGRRRRRVASARRSRDAPLPRQPRSGSLAARLRPRRPRCAPASPTTDEPPQSSVGGGGRDRRIGLCRCAQRDRRRSSRRGSEFLGISAGFAPS